MTIVGLMGDAGVGGSAGRVLGLRRSSDTVIRVLGVLFALVVLFEAAV